MDQFIEKIFLFLFPIIFPITIGVLDYFSSKRLIKEKYFHSLEIFQAFTQFNRGSFAFWSGYPSILFIIQILRGTNNTLFFLKEGFLNIYSVIGLLVTGIVYCLLFLWAWKSKNIDLIFQISTAEGKTNVRSRLQYRIIISAVSILFLAEVVYLIIRDF
ncbi:MAG: hypothetical protein K1Y36_05410 [Blastocatellia bacterium]|nr:hypothetical protein [Blastocatellia bacterium]